MKGMERRFRWQRPPCVPFPGDNLGLVPSRTRYQINKKSLPLAQKYMLKIGLLGAGHLGKIHLKLLKTISAVEVVGFFDSDPEVSQRVSTEFEVPAFDRLEELLAKVDAVDIVTPTLHHFECAKMAIERDKHIFIEKPLTHTVEEAEALVAMLAARPHLKAQVGHVERFNPAFLAVQDRELDPMFIEGHRLALWNPRGTDVSVVLDLMIHDLDVILSLIKSPIRTVSASGVAVISESPDIANARIEFENGCVANLTASRISIKNMRRLRIIQKGGYLAVDFLKKKAEVFHLEENKEIAQKGLMHFEFQAGDTTKYLVYEAPEVSEVNAIKMELEEFAASILHNAPMRVPIADGYRALKAAHQVLAKINELSERTGMSFKP